MKFRTEIEPVKTRHSIGIDQPLLMLGSCFTDNIGQRLAIDGFDVLHNPLGPLYNPMSLARCIRRAFAGQYYTEADLVPGPRGWHCLDYASRYSGEDATELLTRLNRDFGTVVDRLANPRLHTLIVTFGSSYVFERQGSVVGNCHKFPATEFRRRRLSVKEIVDTWATIVGSLPDNIDIIFTVSPIRHLADGCTATRSARPRCSSPSRNFIRTTPSAPITSPRMKSCSTTCATTASMPPT